MLPAIVAAGCDRSNSSVCRAHDDCRVCQRCVNGACKDDPTLPNCEPPRCEDCLTHGRSCGETCRDAGYPAGYCGAPTSTDPSVCCACDEVACDMPLDGVYDRGELLGRSGIHDYAPSVILDTAHSLRAWWCSRGANGMDAMFYAWSNSWAGWSEPVEVLNGAGPPHQGQTAGSPSVVRSGDGQYSMFFTSEDASRAPEVRYQIFLARSADGITWEPAVDGRPVVPLLDPGDDLGSPSALIRNGRIMLFYTRKVGRYNQVLVAESSDHGASFLLRDDGRPVLDGIGACDFAFLPRQDRFLAVCQSDGGLEQLHFYLLAPDLDVIADLEPGGDRWLQPCNHSPGLLRDSSGAAIVESIVPVFFGAGPRAGDSCWNPNGWDIHAADLYLEALLNVDCR